MNTIKLPSQYARQKAAQAWCADTTKSSVMDPAVAEEFARILDAELKQMADVGEFLWTVVANVSLGDWSKQPENWREAAARARDDFHDACKRVGLTGVA